MSDNSQIIRNFISYYHSEISQILSLNINNEIIKSHITEHNMYSHRLITANISIRLKIAMFLNSLSFDLDEIHSIHDNSFYIDRNIQSITDEHSRYVASCVLYMLRIYCNIEYIKYGVFIAMCSFIDNIVNFNTTTNTNISNIILYPSTCIHEYYTLNDFEYEQFENTLASNILTLNLIV